jgi:hypothetical protein
LNFLNISKPNYISNLPESQYLSCIFSLLSLGKCYYHHKDNNETWYFCW